MNITQNCTRYFSGLLPTFNTTPAQELQQAISLGNLEGITRLGNANLLSTPLPNGELPLNYAVRLSQMKSVQKLLELGANPIALDDQHLSAISTAYLKNDQELVKTLMHYVFKDLDIGREMRDGGNPSKPTTQLFNLVNHCHQEITKIITLMPKDSTTSQDFVQQLIQRIGKTGNVNKYKGTSILHIAILTGNKDILLRLLQDKNNSTIINSALNHADKNGLTPLHYAAAIGRLDLMKMLVEKGATLQKNNSSPSPFALLATKFHHQSPLAISKYDAAMFFCSMALWSSQLLPSEMTPPRFLQALHVANNSSLLFNFDKYGIALSLLSIIGMNASYISEDLNSVSMLVSTALTMKLAYQTFQGLRSCWRNSSLGRGKALLKSAVVYMPKVALSFNQLRSLAQRYGLQNTTMAKSFSQNFSELNKRDIKCLQRSYDTGEIAERCFEKSNNIFTSCAIDDKSSQCSTDVQAFEDYLRHADIGIYNDAICQHLGTDPQRECDYKLANWRKKCYTIDSLFDPQACGKAEKMFMESKEEDFEPNYQDSFWRKDFWKKKQGFVCPPEVHTDCNIKLKEWQKICQTKTVSTFEKAMNSDSCIIAEKIFKEGLNGGLNDGFVITYEDPYWMEKKFAEENQSYECPEDTQIDCEAKVQSWKEHCKIDEGIQEIFKAKFNLECMIAKKNFEKGIKIGFEKNPFEFDSFKIFGSLSGYVPGTKLWNCQQAIKSITGNANSNFKKVKEIMKQTHPDKGGSQAAFVKLEPLYVLVKECYDDNMIT